MGLFLAYEIRLMPYPTFTLSETLKYTKFNKIP